MFQKNGIVATFVGRLLPGIRHVISLPAGMFHMPLLTFSIVTFLGATLWSGILAYLGYAFGNKAIEFIEIYLHEAKIIIVIL